ncbi:hypothetical protein KJ885_05440 [Patescibacteria group bacterium]|nr:hypothetical protein [Patescibacteria group bacterium]
MLIATLPAVHEEILMEKIISHPFVGGVRYNTGAKSPFSPKETLERVLALTTEYGKKLWVDLKGRQLRITHWAVPRSGEIRLNHKVEFEPPARVYFRGDEYSELKFVRDNVIYVDPQPRHAVGEGQAINIIGDNVSVVGYSTEQDLEYIAAACELGIFNFMLSFVESVDDAVEVWEAIKKSEGDCEDCELVLKIESQKGLELIRKTELIPLRTCRLMAARDDLLINLDDDWNLLDDAQRLLISRDPNAILASRIFSGLEKNGMATLEDAVDLWRAQEMGYRHFMLSDGISCYHFDEAIRAWQDFLEICSGQ